MNREILFRGKRLGNNEWLYGSHFTDSGEDYIIPQNLLGINDYEEYQVDQNTVGQFTGQYDKNDKKIYEGDIVRWDKDQKLYVVEFRSGMFYASVEPCNPHIYGGFPLWFLCEEEQHCEIVGNRYDNPELLSTK